MYRTCCVKWQKNTDWLVCYMRNRSVTSTVQENTSIGPWKLTKERIFWIRALLPLKMRDLWSHFDLILIFIQCLSLLIFIVYSSKFRRHCEVVVGHCHLTFVCLFVCLFLMFSFSVIFDSNYSCYSFTWWSHSWCHCNSWQYLSVLSIQNLNHFLIWNYDTTMWWWV
jgi:hypothetical protein